MFNTQEINVDVELHVGVTVPGDGVTFYIHLLQAVDLPNQAYSGATIMLDSALDAEDSLGVLEVDILLFLTCHNR